MRKREDSISGKVKTDLKERNAWTYKLLTENEGHAAFLHMYD